MPESSPAPLVSVLMTSFNRETLIAEAIESVLGQTFGDFELIVCDDASSDRTIAIVEAYARRDPRVRLATHDRNVGDYPNRNRAAGYARGGYIKFHDSDDVMYPHCLQVMVTALEREPRADFALSASHAWPGAPCPMLLTPKLAYERELFGTGIFQLGPGSAMFRTAFFRSLGGFALEGTASDYLFWYRACLRAHVLLVPGDLFHYRIHSGQEIVSARAVNDYARARGTVWKLLNSPDCPIDGPRIEQARCNFVFTVVRDAYHSIRGGRYATARTQLKLLGLSPSEWLRYLRPPRRRFDAGTPASAA